MCRNDAKNKFSKSSEFGTKIRCKSAYGNSEMLLKYLTQEIDVFKHIVMHRLHHGNVENYRRNDEIILVHYSYIQLKSK